jgi:arylsulfatase A-like enzyme
MSTTQTDADQRAELDSLLDVDTMLQQLFTAVRDRGSWDRTIVVFVSDNGYSYGAHRWENKRCPYEECIRVPLFVRDPVGGFTHRSDRLASTVDIAGTVARLAGVAPDIAQDGRNLVPILVGAPVPWRSRALLLEYRTDGPVPSWWAVRTWNYLYDELGTGERELYNLSSDPYELTNVAGWARYASVQGALACQLRSLKGRPC